MKNDFILPDIQTLLVKQGLASFEALWNLQVEAVDEPNTERGGWSSVAYLKLDDVGLYLHRQDGHMTRTWQAPLGEPTFAREFRAIKKFQALNIPAVSAALFMRRGRRSIMLTYALEGWHDLDAYLQRWGELKQEQQQGAIKASAELALTLHQAKQLHGCFYPKHIFLKENAAGQFAAQLIDLEKTRPFFLSKRDKIKDLETLMRRTKKHWQEAEWKLFLQTYLANESEAEQFYQHLLARTQNKGKRK